MKEILLFIYALLWLYSSDPGPGAIVGPGGIATEKVKAAHRYHGILISHEDPDGSAYFFRNGQRCQLYTKAFIKSYGI